MDTKQAEVLRLANILRGIDTRSRFANERLSSASDALENQHARITDLESQLAQRFDAVDVATAAAQGFRDGVASVSAGSEPADTVVLNAAMRAIQQAIELIGAPTDERMRAVRRVLRGSVIVAEDAGKVAPLPAVVYAELPVPNYPKSGGFPGTFAEAQMRAFADATCAMRASHGQALRLLTQKEKDSLGHRAEGMDGNDWDQWVQEKFAQVNGLRVQGGSYEWDLE